MEQPDITEFLGDTANSGLAGIGLAAFGLLWFLAGVGTAYVIWG